MPLIDIFEGKQVRMRRIFEKMLAFCDKIVLEMIKITRSTDKFFYRNIASKRIVMAKWQFLGNLPAKPVVVECFDCHGVMFL